MRSTKSHTSRFLGLAIAASVGLLASRADAFEAKHTASGKLVHWSSSQVSFAVDPSVSGIANAPAAVATIASAWSGVGGAPELSTSNASTTTTIGQSSMNTVYFVPSGYGPAGDALAVTILSYSEDTGEILHADIVVNGENSIAVLPAGSTAAAGAVPMSNEPVPGSSSSSSASNDTAPAQPAWGTVSGSESFDFDHVLAHELGHSLGLSDETTSNAALMYLYTLPGDATMRAPQADDAAGVSSVYDDPTSAHGAGCSGATVAAGRPTSGQGWSSIVLMFGFAMFLAARGRTRRVVPALIALSLFGIAAKSARSSESIRTLGHATGHVVAADTKMVDGVWKTTSHVHTTSCRIASCPSDTTVETWGGTVDGVTQVVGEVRSPRLGEDLAVDFSRAADGSSAARIHLTPEYLRGNPTALAP